MDRLRQFRVLDVEENMFQKSVEYIFLHIYSNAESWRREKFKRVVAFIWKNIATEGAFHLPPLTSNSKHRIHDFILIYTFYGILTIPKFTRHHNIEAKLSLIEMSHAKKAQPRKDLTQNQDDQDEGNF